jgi:hypothetical protein
VNKKKNNNSNPHLLSPLTSRLSGSEIRGIQHPIIKRLVPRYLQATGGDSSIIFVFFSDAGQKARQHSPSACSRYEISGKTSLYYLIRINVNKMISAVDFRPIGTIEIE